MYGDDAHIKGRMFFSAYRAASRLTGRPLIFCWNGGPGAPSTILHLQSFGPVRIADGNFIDNDDSLLPEADLIFVDPIDTGYSRSASPKYAAEFYGTVADVKWATRFVLDWCRHFRATDRPIYLMGESFGGPRVAGVAELLARAGAPLAGIIQISAGKILIDANLSQVEKAVYSLPPMAMTAYWHGRLEASYGSSVTAVRDNALAWSTSVYAQGLAGLISAKDSRPDLAAQLAGWLGFAPALVSPVNPVIDRRTFRHGLIPGKVLETYDMRVFEGFGQANMSGRDREAVRRYFSESLNYRASLAYWDMDVRPDQPAVNENWTYTGDSSAIEEAIAGGGPPEREPWLSRAIERSPGLRVLVATGVWDSQNSHAADAALLSKASPAEQAAISAIAYDAGHMIGHDDKARSALRQDIAKMIKRSGIP